MPLTRPQDPEAPFMRDQDDVFSALSPNHILPFTSCDIQFTSAHQFYQCAKAALFVDQESVNLIMATTDPKELKRLGSLVKSYKHDIWRKKSLSVWVRAIQQIVETSKDAQAFRNLLLATRERKITYVPSVDNTLTVGLLHDIRNQQPGHVSDYSTVGEALEEVRSALVRRTELEAAKAQEQQQDVEQEQEQKSDSAKQDKKLSSNKRKAGSVELRQYEKRTDKKAKQQNSISKATQTEWPTNTGQILDEGLPENWWVPKSARTKRYGRVTEHMRR